MKTQPIPSESSLLLMIANADKEGFTHSAQALRDIYFRHYTQLKRQAFKDSHNPWGAPPSSNFPATGAND